MVTTGVLYPQIRKSPGLVGQGMVNGWLNSGGFDGKLSGNPMQRNQNRKNVKQWDVNEDVL